MNTENYSPARGGGITTPTILCIIILLSTKLQISSSSSWVPSKRRLLPSGRNNLTNRSNNCLWGYSQRKICVMDELLVASLRGGALLEDEEEESDLEEEYDVESEEEEEESDDEEEEESDDDEEEEEYSEEDEYDEEYDVESDEDEEESSLAKSVKVKVGGQSDDDDRAVFDDPLVPSPMQQMSMTIGIMIACRRVDLFDPKVVRIARFVFISYALITQLFLAYVRIKARRINDRTPITLNNPLSSVVQSQLSKNDSSSGSGSSGGTSDMVKNLAGQFLSSQTTILEYDLKQAKSMSNSLLFPLAFNWFLHFKMNQVQPLLFQTANGLSNLFYSPLFQVYVLGRNLERPFKSVNAMAEKMEALKKQQEEEAAAAKKVAEEEESVSVEEEEEEDATEVEEQEQSDDEEYDEEESEEEDANGKDEEYDEDEYDEEGEES